MAWFAGAISGFCRSSAIAVWLHGASHNVRTFVPGDWFFTGRRTLRWIAGRAAYRNGLCAGWNGRCAGFGDLHGATRPSQSGCRGPATNSMRSRLSSLGEQHFRRHGLSATEHFSAGLPSRSCGMALNKPVSRAKSPVCSRGCCSSGAMQFGRAKNNLQACVGVGKRCRNPGSKN